MIFQDLLDILNCFSLKKLILTSQLQFVPLWYGDLAVPALCSAKLNLFSEAESDPDVGKIELFLTSQLQFVPPDVGKIELFLTSQLQFVPPDVGKIEINNNNNKMNK